MVVEAEAEAQAAPAEPVAPVLTFGGWLDEWWVAKRTALSPSSVAPWRSAIELHLKPSLGELPLGELRLHDLEDVYQRLVDGGLSPGRVQKVHTVASVALNAAVRRGLIAASPAALAKPPGGRRSEPDPPTPQEVAQLLTAAHAADPDLYEFLVVAANTGARRGEICALRWSDLDVGNRVLTIARAVVKGGGDGVVVRQTKTGAVGRIAVSQQVVDVLRQRQERLASALGGANVERPADGFIWSQDPEGSRPIYPDTISVRFRALRERAGLDHVELRQFRHYTATQLLAAGIDVRTVAGRLRHARPAMTLDRYAAWVPARDREAADLLEGINGGATEAAAGS
jgi:integrase